MCIIVIFKSPLEITIFLVLCEAGEGCEVELGGVGVEGLVVVVVLVWGRGRRVQVGFFFQTKIFDGFHMFLSLKVRICSNKYKCYQVQLYSKKCTERYFKVKDDDLSSKQGSLCTFK